MSDPVSCLCDRTQFYTIFLQIIALRVSTMAMASLKRSYDNVEKSQEDRRSYKGLELNNGIKVWIYFSKNFKLSSSVSISVSVCPKV